MGLGRAARPVVWRSPPPPPHRLNSRFHGGGGGGRPYVTPGRRGLPGSPRPRPRTAAAGTWPPRPTCTGGAELRGGGGGRQGLLLPPPPYSLPRGEPGAGHGQAGPARRRRWPHPAPGLPRSALLFGALNTTPPPPSPMLDRAAAPPGHRAPRWVGGWGGRAPPEEGSAGLGPGSGFLRRRDPVCPGGGCPGLGLLPGTGSGDALVTPKTLPSPPRVICSLMLFSLNAYFCCIINGG